MKLSKKQIDKLSDISSDLGLVAVASVVIPAAVDRFSLVAVVYGLLVALGFWIFSIMLRR